MPSSIYDIAIIGGGASGLAAAIVAAHEGARVLIIERDVEAGLPLLATGNGRCNLSLPTTSTALAVRVVPVRRAGRSPS